MTRKRNDGARANGAASRNVSGRDAGGRKAGAHDAGEPARSKSGSGLSRLRGGLTGERSLVGVSYMDDPAMLRAYLDYFWPVSREQARVALAVTRRFERSRGVTGVMADTTCAADTAGAADAPFRRVIDVGSGPGPVAAAFIDSGAEEVALVDQSESALALARKTITARCDREASVMTASADISSPDPASIPLWGKADCVSFGHCLNELWADREDRVARRADLIERYASALAGGGRVFVIEPALLSTSRDVLAVRNLLVGRGWSVLAPCPGRSRLECPALAAGAQHTCHEEIAWVAPPSVVALAREEGLDKDSLKMTWFMLAPPERAECDARSVDRAYRVVSDPMLNKGGRVRRLLCGALGRFPLSAADGSEDSRRTGFDRLARGDIVSVLKPETRENGWGIDAMTEIARVGEES